MPKIKFDKPTPIKSGRDVVEVWNELKSFWRKYKMFRLEDDKINMCIWAKKIRKNQDDMGMKQTGFPELDVFDNKVSRIT